MSDTQTIHTAKVSWMDGGQPYYEVFASLDGELYYSFGRDLPEGCAPEDVQAKVDGADGFKPMAYHRRFFGQIMDVSYPVHVEFSDA